jgi:hydroxymethylglutaryl-CoA lyase
MDGLLFVHPLVQAIIGRAANACIYAKTTLPGPWDDDMTAKTIDILEVGARDGLQNEDIAFTTDQKISLINRALDAGITRIEVASFAHPDVVPQMADAEAVIAGLAPDADAQYTGLVLNKRGFLRALDTRRGGARGVDEVGCVCVMSETFSEKNQGMSISRSIEVASEIMALGNREGMGVQVTLAAAFGCGFEGNIDQSKVVDAAMRLAESGPAEFSIADTIGAAVPNQVTDMIGALKEAVPGIPLRGHFHDTRNTGVANGWAACEAGIETLDSSVAGLGGCPFAPRATGNVATEDVVYMLHRSGVDTGIDLTKLIEISAWLETILGRPTPAMVSQAGLFPVASS